MLTFDSKLYSSYSIKCHNVLSLFSNVPRFPSEPQKISYWKLNLTGKIYSICLFWWSRDGDPIPGHEKLPEMSKVQLLNRSRELFQSFSLWEIFRPDHVSRSFRDKWKNCQSLLRNFKRALEFNSYREVDNYFQLLHEAQLQQENCRFLPEGSIVFD